MSVVLHNCMRVSDASQASSSRWRAAGMALMRSEAPCAKGRLRNPAPQARVMGWRERTAREMGGGWVVWFKGGLGLWGEAGVDEEAIDMVSDLSGAVEESFLGRIRKSRCRR